MRYFIYEQFIHHVHQFLGHCALGRHRLLTFRKSPMQKHPDFISDVHRISSFWQESVQAFPCVHRELGPHRDLRGALPAAAPSDFWVSEPAQSVPAASVPITKTARQRRRTEDIPRIILSILIDVVDFQVDTDWDLGTARLLKSPPTAIVEVLMNGGDCPNWTSK